jgi:hypothetical protein
MNTAAGGQLLNAGICRGAYPGSDRRSRADGELLERLAK